MPHAVHPRQIGLIHHLDAAQPLDIDVARPAGNDEPQRVAVLRAQRLAVLTVGDQDVVHRLRHGDAALVAAGVGALGHDPGGALLDAGLAQQERERHAGPLAAARRPCGPGRSSSGHAPLHHRMLPWHSRKRMRDVEGRRLISSTVRITGRSTMPWIRRRCLRGSMSGTPPRWTS